MVGRKPGQKKNGAEPVGSVAASPRNPPLHNREGQNIANGQGDSAAIRGMQTAKSALTTERSAMTSSRTENRSNLVSNTKKLPVVNDDGSAVENGTRSNADEQQQRQTKRNPRPSKSRQQQQQPTNTALRGKRVRLARLALVRDGGTAARSDVNRKRSLQRESKLHRPLETPKLQPNQYETTLVRRAIRKAEDQFSGVNAPGSAVTDGDMDVYGDVSLGMQLVPEGGKIIVQGLNPLQDGRASPAQLAGYIQRGDVLLQINHQSLVNSPFAQLISGLNSLSNPFADGTYPRRITLRFASGQGIDLLKEAQAVRRQRQTLAARAAESSDPAREATASNSAPVASTFASDHVDGAADILGLFTMVDHLSGLPLFREEEPPAPPPQTQPTQQTEESSSHSLTTDAVPDPDQKRTENLVEKPASLSIQPTRLQQPLSLEEAISQIIANERHAEREECDSEFFSWNDYFSLLLRRPQQRDDGPRQLAFDDTDSKDDRNMTNDDESKLGHQAFQGARKLSAILEKIDHGWSDRRSFRSFSATLSLYSKASKRPRYALDNKGLPANIEELDEGDDDGDSTKAVESADRSVGSDEQEDVDGDGLLLQLAAGDQVWKKQVIEFLDDVVQKLDNPDENTDQNAVLAEDNEKATSAVSSELGSFLFGDRISKALMLHKKPHALPPDEITALLHDLQDKITSEVPDQIEAVTGSAARQALPPFLAKKNLAASSNKMQALRFLLDEVLPVWLKTFRPLPWDQRRVLCPLEKPPPPDPTGGSTRSDDSMTVDSANTRQQHPEKKQRNRGLREQIEDQELDVETRSETCALVTLYFNQQLLPALMKDTDENSHARQAAVSFVQDYGAYLRLDSCIANAAILKEQNVIEVLVEAGKHDPRHREDLRRLSVDDIEENEYEKASLPAILERLFNLHKESSSDQQLATIRMCALAYPDVRPWQLKRECMRHVKNMKQRASYKQLYYQYLSRLLDPKTGREEPRGDAGLVIEWAELSVRGYLEQQQKNSNQAFAGREWKKNFFAVASKSSSDHLLYSRNLTALLELAMEAKEYPLALDLAAEILDSEGIKKTSDLFNKITSALRTVGCATVDSFEDNNSMAQRTLKRAFRLFQRAGGTRMAGEAWIVDVPSEIIRLLDHATKVFGSDRRHKLVFFVDYLSKEVSPRELLLALAAWSSKEPKMRSDLFLILRTVLRRGASGERAAELSTSLQRVRQARLDLRGIDAERDTEQDDTAAEGSGLWKNMSRGDLPLVK